MKSFLVSALFVAFLGLAYGAAIENTIGSSEEVKEWKLGAVKKYLNDSGYLDEVYDPLEEWCTGSSQKIEAALESLIECDAAIPDTVTTCDSVRNHALNCMKPLIKSVSDCLPAESKDLPETAVKSMISVFDYICKQDGEHILELANSCTYDIDEEDPKIKACGESIESSIDEWRETLPTKTKVCNLGKDVRGCLQTHINKSCANEKTRNANLGFIDAILAPCNAS